MDELLEDKNGAVTTFENSPEKPEPKPNQLMPSSSFGLKPPGSHPLPQTLGPGIFGNQKLNHLSRENFLQKPNSASVPAL